MLQKSLLPNIFVEKLLTKLRCEILFNLEISSKYNLNEHFNIKVFERLNGFAYIQSEKDQYYGKKI